MPRMKTIEEIRHTNLLALIVNAGSTQSVASAAKKAHSQISQIATRQPHSKTGKPRNIGSRMARELEVAMHKPVGWMDQPHLTDDEALQAKVDRMVEASLKKLAAPPARTTTKRPAGG
jgi:hypothetical protein